MARTIANAREAESRAAAERALAEARDRARARGAEDLARALEEERSLLHKRGERASLARQLAEAMKKAGVSTPDTARRLETLDREKNDSAARSLSDALERALGSLTPEQRERLAKNLAEQAKASPSASSQRRDTSDLAKKLSTPEGAAELAASLRALADAKLESGEAKTGQGLGDAELSLQAAQAGAAVAGGQSPGEGDGESGPSDARDGPGGPGTHDTGTGTHAGRSARVAGGGFTARARGAATGPGGVPLPGAGGRQSAQGSAATIGTSGDLTTAGPAELEGIDRSDMPEDYREHVRAYFKP